MIPVITVDGPSGVGKGTLCKALTELLKWNLLDSGTIYRVLAVAALNNKLDINIEESLIPIAESLDIKIISKNKQFRVILEGKDITNVISTEAIGKSASQVATFPRVRAALLFRQHSFRKKPGLVADGRDMGTVVFPDAPVKIFLDASVQACASRRFLQLKSRGFNVSLNRILIDIQERDNLDRSRLVAPLIPAVDALLLDSTNMSIEQVINASLIYIERKLPMEKSVGYMM